ncbi:MAG: tetratricopeptide repeat protein [Methylococcales bacterium]
MSENRGPVISSRKNLRNCDGYAVGFSLLVVLLWVFQIYRPALNGPFLFDDAPNIVENGALHLSALNWENIAFALDSVQAGPFGRPLAYLSFALNEYFFGPEPYSFKLINLIIHLANGICVFLFVRLLLRAFRLVYRVHLDKQRIQWLALATASLWMLHPLALTSVLYTVQRMNSLAALFSLLTFIFYFSGRLKQFTKHSGMLPMGLAFGLFAPLAVLSKENAVLIPGFLLVGDWILLRFKSPSRSGRWIVCGLLYGTVLFLALIVSLREFLLNSLIASYALKPFTLTEHVLTESRVLWFYLKLVFIPHPADFGLYHDDIPLSRGFFQPITTLLSVAGLILLAGVAFWIREKAPIVSFGVLFFLLGHSIESSLFPLEIAHEHRNYLPMMGLIFMLAYYGLRLHWMHHAGHVVFAGLILLAGLFSASSMNLASDWKDIGSLSMSLVEHHPDSARSNYEAGRVLSTIIEEDPKAPRVEQYYQWARHFFTRSCESDEFNPGGLFGRIYLDALLDRGTDEGTATRLMRRLSEYPLVPTTAMSFTTLQRCYERGRCHLETKLLMRLYEAALNNPQASGIIRSSLSNELAILNLEQQDVNSAVGLFRQAIALNPSQTRLRFNLVRVLLSTGQLEEAHTELRSIREQISRIQEKQELTQLEKTYAQARLFKNPL